jgi:hypothetical protein
MKKLFLVASLAVINMALASDTAQPKTVLTFPIMIDDKGNPVKTNGFLPDEMDKFSCKILNISWPEKKEEKLWLVKKLFYTKPDSETQYTGSTIPMEYCVDDPNMVNPYQNKEMNMNKTFSFPRALPDAFIQELVKRREIIHELPNSTIRFVLQNSEESLKELCLISKSPEQGSQETAKGRLFSFRNVLCVSIPVGLLGFIVWLWSKKSA